MPRARALQQEKLPKWEALTPQLESGPHSQQPEKAHVQQQRPSSAKNKWTYFLKKRERKIRSRRKYELKEDTGNVSILETK